MRPSRLAAPAGALALILHAAAPLEAAEPPVAAENLVIDLGPTIYRIPRLEAEGTTLTGADIARLFDPKDAAPLAERLGRLSAARARMPEIVGETKAGGVTQRLVYHDVTIENLVAGRAGTLRAASMDQSAERANGPRIVAHYGAMTVKGADFGQIAHVVGDVRADDKEAAKPVEEEGIVEGATFSVPEARFEIRFGRLVASGVKARPFLEPLPRVFERLPAQGAGSPEEGAGVALSLLDALGSVEIGAIEARDIALTGVAAPVDKPYAMTFGRIAMTKLAGSVVGDAAIDDFALTAADGGVLTARRLLVKGLDPRPMIESAARPLPRVERVELSDLSADLPDTKTSDASRVKFKVAAASADFANYREGLPTKIAARLDHVAIDLAARGETPATAQFLALGYRDLDVSLALDAEWREKEAELVVGALRLDSKDMGALTLAATFGNVSGAVFSTNPIVSRAAALASSVKRVEATLDGGGLVDRLLAVEAKAQGAPVAKLRADFARDLEAAIPALLGGGDKSRRIGEAVGKYVADPKRLELRLDAPKGVNALDLLAKKPGAILEEAEVEVYAGR